MQQRNGFFLSWMTGLAMVSTCFSSCLKGGSPTTTNNTPMTYISVLHLAPYVPAVDIYINGTQASQPISPDTYFPNYSQVAPGMYDVKFEKDGSDSLVAEIPNYQYDSLSFYTILLYNTGQNMAKAVTIPDDFSNVTNAMTYYRFFNMNPDLGGVDVYFSNTLVQSNRTPADNVTSGSTYNRFKGITPGYYTVTVKAAGTDSLITSASSIDILAGNVYTLLLTGKGTQSSFSVLPGTY